MERTDGARLFDAFLEANRVGPSDAGKALDVAPSTIIDLRRGSKRPKQPLAARIARWTDGAVPETMWLTAEERVDIARTKPFEPKADESGPIAAQPATKTG